MTGQRPSLTKSEHIKRHVHLHTTLDELVADFIEHTEKLPSKTTIMELMNWSHGQTKEPTSNEAHTEPNEDHLKVDNNHSPWRMKCEMCGADEPLPENCSLGWVGEAMNLFRDLHRYCEGSREAKK